MSTMNSFLLSDSTKVIFPYKPYPHQVKIMDRIGQGINNSVNVVIDSPTGTGKTLCAVSVCLAKQELEKKRPFRLIFAARTHVQLAQVATELRKTFYATKIKCVTLGSRGHLCIQPEVRKERHSAAQVSKCNHLIKSKGCKYYDSSSSVEVDGITSIEELCSIGESKCMCPYFYVRNEQPFANVVLVPYSYLLDEKFRDSQRLDLSNNVVVIDEAHNIDSICEDIMSCEITSYDLRNALESLDKLLHFLIFPQSEHIVKELVVSPSDIASVKEILNKLNEAITTEVISDSYSRTLPGTEVYEYFQEAAKNVSTVPEFRTSLQKLIQLASECLAKGLLNQPVAKPLSNIEKLLDIAYHPACERDGMKNFRLHIATMTQRERQQLAIPVQLIKRSWVFSLWCFSAEVVMKLLTAQGTRSVILMSGTLPPLQVFSENLGIPVTQYYKTPSSVTVTNASVCIVKKGPNGRKLNSTLSNRKSEYYMEVGESLLHIAQVVPKGMLVFLPSYELVKLCYHTWHEENIWEKINAIKPVVIEQAEAVDFTVTMSIYSKYCLEEKGAILLGVFRGKLSEGLDLPDDHVRAVVLVGVPFGPIADPRLKAKWDFMNRSNGAVTGDQWYIQEAFKTVNQAIGRVVRHVNDYGSVFLLDERYAFTKERSNLPDWAQYVASEYDYWPDIEKDQRMFFRMYKVLTC